MFIFYLYIIEIFNCQQLFFRWQPFCFMVRVWWQLSSIPSKKSFLRKLTETSMSNPSIRNWLIRCGSSGRYGWSSADFRNRRSRWFRFLWVRTACRACRREPGCPSGCTARSRSRSPGFWAEPEKSIKRSIKYYYNYKSLH